MHQSTPRSTSLVAVLLLVTLSPVGCQSGGWPLARPAAGSPQARIAALRQLASSAARISGAKREQGVADLGRQIQTESDPVLRGEIVRALTSFQTPSSVAILAAACGDSDPDVRIAACAALARNPGPAAAEALGRVIGGDSDVDVRLAATRALANFDRGALPALALALDDSDPALQRRALLSLERITGRNVGGDLAAARRLARGDQTERPAVQAASHTEPAGAPF